MTEDRNDQEPKWKWMYSER